jgi:hypothetical protein
MAIFSLQIASGPALEGRLHHLRDAAEIPPEIGVRGRRFAPPV